MITLHKDVPFVVKMRTSPTSVIAPEIGKRDIRFYVLRHQIRSFSSEITTIRQVTVCFIAVQARNKPHCCSMGQRIFIFQLPARSNR
jgi:hypothetical protein